MSELQLRRAICDVGHLLWQGGLVNGRQGVITARLSANKMVCTPSAQSKGHLDPGDLFVLPIRAKSTSKAKSSTKKSQEDAAHADLLTHQEIYRLRPDCGAVVQAFPPIATSFSLVGDDIPDNLLPESASELGSVASVPFARPGTQDDLDLMRLYIADHKTFLLSHRGALALGKDVYEAAYRIESLESVAKVVLHARLLGEPRSMPLGDFDWYLKTALNGDLG
ncbi:MAG: class II aldolase/adducin family protein [Armatimonadetes bacterium]|nr:class II aldolase/adducin family protein [Armatimonadota bacterium]